MKNTGKELHGALNMARRALAILEEQVAGYTVLTIPVHLKLEREPRHPARRKG